MPAVAVLVFHMRARSVSKVVINRHGRSRTMSASASTPRVTSASASMLLEATGQSRVQDKSRKNFMGGVGSGHLCWEQPTRDSPPPPLLVPCHAHREQPPLHLEAQAPPTRPAAPPSRGSPSRTAAGCTRPLLSEQASGSRRRRRDALRKHTTSES